MAAAEYENLQNWRKISPAMRQEILRLAKNGGIKTAISLIWDKGNSVSGNPAETVKGAKIPADYALLGDLYDEIEEYQATGLYRGGLELSLKKYMEQKK